MATRIRLGISTCPNDTFAFHGLLNRLVDWRGLDFEVELLDIQQLNERLMGHEFDVAKASFHAATRLADQMVVLPSGSALGFGVGPLLLSANAGQSPSAAAHSGSVKCVTLCPGELTTAALLYRMFYAGGCPVSHVVFSEIMPMLKRHEADFGVCIHEGRFTWQKEGLHLVEDLGERWEAETGSPLPLGGIVARRELPHAVVATVQSVIRESLNLALSVPESALPTMRRYAQELDDSVLMQHVDLYVNQWTCDLGEVGAAALAELSRRAANVGIHNDAKRPLEIFSP